MLACAFFGYHIFSFFQLAQGCSGNKHTAYCVLDQKSAPVKVIQQLDFPVTPTRNADLVDALRSGVVAIQNTD